jgi:outer membrane protein OmpA-like peptidoglycan-associated protein
MSSSPTGTKKAFLAGLLVIGLADLAWLDLVAAPAYVRTEAAPPAAGSGTEAVSTTRPQSPGPSTVATGRPRQPGSSGSSVPNAVAEGEPAADATGMAAAAPSAQPAAGVATAVAVGEPPADGTAGGPTAAGSPSGQGQRPSATVVRFATASAAITDATSLVLVGVIRQLEQQPTLRVVLRGFADERGGAEFNAWLSLRRAQAVAEVLEHSGIAAGRISVTGQGSSQPVDTSGTPDALAANRRVEIVWR